MWFEKLVRQFFYLIDSTVYNGIVNVYRLLIDISRTSVLSQSSIQSIGNRLYQMLAIFMAFKIIFSLIMYVVNPDDFSDKSKGVSKLGLNVVITLSLLVLTPYLFSYAFRLQNIILESNSIGTLIFGDFESDSDTEFSIFASAGDDIAFYAMKPFFLPKSTISGLTSCATVEENGKFNEKCSGIDFESENDDQFSGYSDSLAGFVDDDTNYETNYSLTDVKNYVYGFEKKRLPLMFRQEMVSATVKDANDKDAKKEFIIDYKIVLSTAVGVIILLLLISFCMDVAVRSIKLAFLQIIAPIPIISYLDPKSGKDGMFKKWYQICFKTYLSLFIRLLALYFAVYIISKVGKMSDVLNGAYQSDIRIQIFVIIGALMFAKQLPKILEGLGVKLDGDGKFILNPLKKFEEQAIGGKRITGFAGAMGASLIDRGARLATAPGFKGKAAALVGTPFGALGAGLRGARANSGFSGGIKKQADVNRRLRENRIKGLSASAAYFDYLGSQFGLDDATLEKEGTLVQRNKEAIAQANREIAEETRENELAIAKEQQKLKPLKSVESRRGAVQSAAEKLKSNAEDFASKKADFKMKGLQYEQSEAIKKLKRGEALSAREQTLLAAKGITDFRRSSDIADDAVRAQRDLAVARVEREVNSNQYTTNRRADAANVKYLEDNMGKKLETSIVIGEGADKVEIAAGTVIDGKLVADAQAAQGKYIKKSQKAVYNELAKESGSEYASADEYASFKTDYDAFEETVKLANSEIHNYSGNNPYGIELTTFDEGTRSYEKTDEMINKVKSSEDTTKITTAVNESNSKIETMEKQNADIKSRKQIDYYDENGHKIKGKNLAEAESEFKPREQAHKDNLEKHQERRSVWKSMSGK